MNKTIRKRPISKASLKTTSKPDICINERILELN